MKKDQFKQEKLDKVRKEEEERFAKEKLKQEEEQKEKDKKLKQQQDLKIVSLLNIYYITIKEIIVNYRSISDKKST